MKKIFRDFISGVIAGGLIGIGVLIYLNLYQVNKIVGSLFFAIGLYSIICFSLNLYTGKIGFVFHQKKDYLLLLISSLIGNFIGIGCVSLIATLTRNNTLIQENAQSIVALKDNDSYLSIFLLSFLCGVIIYLAVKGHQIINNNVGKVLIVFIPISIFILCGFEHCIANAGYYIIAKSFSLRSLINILIMIIGNSLGSIALDGLFTLLEKLKNN